MKTSYGLLPPKKDFRDIKVSKYRKVMKLGAVSVPDLPLTLGRPRPTTIKQQGNTNLCTGFTAAAIRSAKFKREFSPEWFAMKENLKQGGVWQGASLRTQASVFCSMGILPKELAPLSWDKNGEMTSVNPASWPALEDKALPFKEGTYMTADGDYDTFDNIRVNLATHDTDGEGISAGIAWHPFDWNDCPTGILVEPRDQIMMGHNIRIYDFTTINGVQYLVFENYEGETWGDKGIGYISRQVANECIYTSEGPYIYLDIENIKELKQQLWNTLQKLQDLLIKLWKYLYPTIPLPK